MGLDNETIEACAKRAETFFDRHPDNAPADISARDCGALIAHTLRQLKETE